MDEFKKQSVEHSEDLESPQLHAHHGLEGSTPFTTEQRMVIEKRLRRKLDMRFSILPIVGPRRIVQMSPVPALTLPSRPVDLRSQLYRSVRLARRRRHRPII